MRYLIILFFIYLSSCLAPPKRRPKAAFYDLCSSLSSNKEYFLYRFVSERKLMIYASRTTLFDLKKLPRVIYHTFLSKNKKTLHLVRSSEFLAKKFLEFEFKKDRFSRYSSLKKAGLFLSRKYCDKYFIRNN